MPTPIYLDEPPPQSAPPPQNPPPGPVALAPTAPVYLDEAPPPQPISTAPPTPAGPPQQVEQAPPAPPQGQGPFDGILGPVGPWVQDRVDDVTQPGGLLRGAPRELRTPPPDAVPMGTGFGEDRYAAAGQALQQGNVKDAAGAALQGNYGDATPFRATNIDVQVEQWLREDDPALALDLYGPPKQQPPTMQALSSVYGSDIPVLNQFREHMRQNPDVYRQIAQEGYVSADGLVYQGARALYEYYQSGQSGLQRGLTDIVMDPVGTPIDIAGTVATGGGWAVGKGAAKTALRGGVRVLDAIGTAGLSEAIPGTLRLAGKAGRATGLLSPSKQGLAIASGEEVAEAGAAALGEARLGGVAPGQQMLTDTGGRTAINTPSGINLTYDVDPTVGIRIWDDPAATTFRTPTQADFDQVMLAMRELPQAERARVTDPWFRYGMRAKDAAGNDLIEPFAPDLPGISTGRNQDAHRRWLEDRADAIRRFDDPDGNRPVLGRLLQDWERTFYGRDLHPLTKQTMARHRLQSIKNLLAEVPEHNNAYARAEVARMEAQLRTPPGSIGSGWFQPKATGKPIPYTPADAEYLRGLATTYSRSFIKGKGPAKRERAAGINPVLIDPAAVKKGLIDPKLPGLKAGTARQNAYANYKAVFAERLQNPVLVRADVGAVRDRFGNAAGTPIGADLRRVLDGFKDVLDENGIIPGARGMADADVEIALNAWLKNTPTFKVNPPPGGWDLAPAPMGAYTPGSASEALRMAFDDTTEELLSRPYDVNGVLKRPWESLIEQQTKLVNARAAAQAQRSGVRLNAIAVRDLSTTVAQTKQLHKAYRGLTAEQLADMSDGELDRLAAATVGEDVARALGYDPAKKGRLLAAYDSFNGMLRSLILYSPARGAIYPMMQLAGNLFTLGIANKGAIRYYNPLDWRSIKRFIDDPELNKASPAIAFREGIGLGRSGNLGIVSRDQGQGRYTWFSDPDRSAFTRTIGKVLAPQPIKNWADAADTMHRHSLWRSVMEPGYKALKKELPDLADDVFREARVRTGLTLPLTRDQISQAIRTLEADSPNRTFTAIELREALMEAAGGATAANKRELFNAADRVHRAYREKLVELDNAAMREVNRVAFDPMETNLDTILSRAFLFSWWNTRAANLYAQEIASSPIMLGIFSRAVVAGSQQREMEGNKSPFVEFMRSPAGFAMMLNPFTLSSTFLMMESLEGPNPKSNLTGLGAFFEGGIVGNNLFLAPLLKASLGWLGALGEDYYRQDITGMRRIERMLNNVAEVVNRDVHTFVQTSGGNPDLVPNIDFNVFQNYFHEHLSGRLPGTMKVPPVDPDRTEQGQYGFFVAQRLLEANPELGVADAEGNVYAFEQAYREILQNPDSAIAQQAMDDYVEMLKGGPGTDRGGFASVVGLAAKEFLIPLQFSAQPTNRVDYWGRRTRDDARQDRPVIGPDGQRLQTADGMPIPEGMLPIAEKTAVDSAMGYLPFETPEGRRYELLENEYYGGNDPAVREAREAQNAIKYATATEPVTLFGSLTFTPEQLAQLSQKDRNAVAQAWMVEQGYADEVSAMYAARDELLSTNPELANGLGWWEYAQQYPGGPMAAFDATALVNPNVARIAENPEFQQLRQTNPEEAEKVVKYLGPTIAGIKSSRYDFPADKRYAGVVGGLDGTVGAWMQEDAASGGSTAVQTVQEEVGEYEDAIAALNTFRPGAGDEYLANLAAGSSRPVPYDAYQAGLRAPTRGGWTADWLTYQAANPDATMEEWDAAQYAAWAEQRTLEIANELATGTYVAEAEDSV